MSRDFVPFMADYVRSSSGSSWTDRDWLNRHNIDRVDRWERDGVAIATRIESREVKDVIRPLITGDYFYARGRLDRGRRHPARLLDQGRHRRPLVHHERTRQPQHGGAARAARDRDAPRHRGGDGRLRAELRRLPDRAAGAAVAVPEPARQRFVGDRRRHGHQHPAAQPRRGDRRGPGLHRGPGDRHRGPDAARQGPRLPGRRHDHGLGGHPRRLPVGPRVGAGPGQGPHRADQERQGGDHRLRAAVHGPQGRRRRADHQDRRSGPRQEADRDLRPPRRVRSLGHAPGHRAEAGRDPEGRAEQALQAHADAVELRGQHGCPRRQRAADPLPEGDDPPLRRPSARGGDPPHAVPAAPGRGQGARPRGNPDRARQPRRGDRPDPRLGEPRRRPRRADLRVRALRHPGAGDPRHAPAAPDRARVRQGPGRARGAAEDDRRAADDPRRREAHRRRDQHRARRPRRALRAIRAGPTSPSPRARWTSRT